MPVGGITPGGIQPQLLANRAATEVPANAITTDSGDPIVTDAGDYITTD